MKTYTLGPLEISFSDLNLKPTDKYRGRRRVFRLLEPFNVSVKNKGITQDYVVGVGTETDLASIPLVLQPLIGSAAEFAEEAVIHDLMCEEECPQFFANATMRFLMEAQGRPRWKKLLIFWALQLFGYGSWFRRKR